MRPPSFLPFALTAGLLGCGAAPAPAAAPTVATAPASQSPPPAPSPPFAGFGPCTGPEYAALDFWIGDWDVVDPKGAPQGHNVIRPTLDHCAIDEQWDDADGSHGRSVFYFDRARRAWKQLWVTDDGLWKEKVQRDDGPPGALRFQGELPRPKGGTMLDRTTLAALPDGRVRQLIEQSIDGGKTWRAWEGLYSKRPVPKPCAGPEYRQMDFWVGDWNAVIKSRNSPTSDQWTEAKGVNHVSRTLSGCGVEESFTGDGPGAPWAGHSVSTFAAPTGKWRQTWIDDSGSYLAFVGGPQGADFVLEGEPHTTKGVTAHMRMVFSSITPKSFHWSWESTHDDGATWVPVMVIDYTRRAPV